MTKNSTTPNSLPEAQVVEEKKRGQIWIANLDPTLGTETGKQRRVLIVSNDIGNKFGGTVLTVPIKSEDVEKKIRLPMFVKIVPDSTNGQTKVAAIDCNQIRALDKDLRLVKLIGTVDETTMEKVDAALELVLSLRNCFVCGQALTRYSKHCTNKECRTVLVHICTVCTRVNDIRYNYCPHCGTKKGGN